MYRIKTKEEFINEFGEHWRGRVDYGFIEDMDYLLGITIPESIYSDFDFDNNLDFKLDRWTISPDMVIKIKDNKPSYKPRTLVYE
jgi:hypothetical protein